MPRALRSALPRLVLALAAIFCFRLLFGLSREFFFEDDTQIFLMGLRWYATGHWPYFGADVVWTMSEIPGALQAVLVGLPLYVLPIPEAPFVLLNLLSTGALAAFCAYVSKRFPAIPRWLVWGWLMTIPWTLQFSTHVINPSYVLPAAIVFFLGFFEAVPALSLGVISQFAAFAMMGAGVTWIMQIHMSWPLLLPFAAYAWTTQRARGWNALATAAVAFGAGALLPALLLIPTWMRYGPGGGGTFRNLHLHAVNPWAIVTSLARFLSFASLEINRFIATDGAKRLAFFVQHPWLAPLAAIAWLVGVVQPIWMLVEGIRRADGPRGWRLMRALVVFSIAVVYASYCLVMEPPQAHAFYSLAPLAFLFAAYCWTFIDTPLWRRVAAFALAVNVAFHAGLAVAQAPVISMYRHRAPVAAAVRLEQPEMFGHRRFFAVDGGPLVLSDPTRPYDAIRDVRIVSAHAETAHGYVTWHVTVRVDNPRVAFRDLIYLTTYVDAAGRTIEQRQERVRDIFEPAEPRELEINDGWAPPGFTAATFRVLSAEALLPAPSR